MAERRRKQPRSGSRERTPGAPARSARGDKPGLVIALSKGRVLEETAARFAQAGVPPRLLLDDDRTLVREHRATGFRFLLLKPDDVPTYVEYGAADLGVVGRDVLLEREYDLYAPLDLEIGRCRLVVAGPRGARPTDRPLRVATKFTNVARRHFLAKGQQVDLVFVQSSVELAPLTGLSDVIVDLVQSGETLRKNGLGILETICDVSSVVVANRVAFKLERARIAPLLAALGR
jgi:ATP phosphoribosyltransferase